MLIISDGERFIIPLAQLWETLEISDDQVGTINEEVMVLSLRNEELPLFSLSSILNKSRKVGLGPNEKIGVITVIDGLKYAIAVDTIVGTQSVVVKDLGLEFSHLRGLSGSAILGDGQPGLILDVPALVNMRTIKKVA
jgi:two-component system chemotaxis sensor kinase CheA